MRQRQAGDMNAKFNAGASSNRTSANGQLERHGFTNKSRMNGPTREGRGLVEGRAMRGELGAHMSVSDERYGKAVVGAASADYTLARTAAMSRGRFAYRERAVGVDAGVAAADYGYRARRLYAYARLTRSVPRRVRIIVTRLATKSRSPQVRIIRQVGMSLTPALTMTTRPASVSA